MNKNILIFDDEIRGHHLEYIEYLYEIASSDLKNNYFFAIPEDIKKYSNEVKAKDNIKIRLLKNSDLEYNRFKSQGKKAYYGSMLIRRLEKEFNINELFLVFIAKYLPYLAFISRKDVKITGIIYNIYLYNWEKSSFTKKATIYITYKILTSFDKIKYLLILNDKSSTSILNKIWNTHKFKYLVDPIKPFSITPSNRLKGDRINLLHFGAIERRKGTIEFLKALELLEPNVANRFSVIIAGKVSKEIAAEVYDLKEKLSSKIRIKIMDKFLDTNEMEYLCKEADIYVIPYYNMAQSSGVVSYAALYNKPVICPQNGLLGKLVKRNELVLTIKDNTPICIAECISSITNAPKTNEDKSKEYIISHSVKEFQKTIFDSLMERS